MPLIERNTFSRDIASFTKGLKKAGRAFKKGGDRVGASQRKKRAASQRMKNNRGRVVSRIPNNHLSNSGKQMK